MTFEDQVSFNPPPLYHIYVHVPVRSRFLLSQSAFYITPFLDLSLVGLKDEKLFKQLLILDTSVCLCSVLYSEIFSLKTPYLSTGRH